MTTTERKPSGERMLVYYPGHLGPRPSVEARGQLVAPWEGPGVRELPAAIGADLVRFSGFIQAVPPAEAAKLFGLEVSDLEGLTTVKYGEPEVELALLDRATVRRLRGLAAKRALASAPAAAPKAAPAAAPPTAPKKES